ncbi:unannotated protein [freshwater metagenome]|uniref:Unannotated protein n=1 Tax=freshwater metagenome TaxID=449393 RepID=A0A6J7HU46_9ZZZZ
MDQRKIGHRAHYQTRTGYIHNARRHDEVHILLLQIPHHLPQTVVADMFGRRHSHGVGTGHLNGLDDAVLVTQHGYLATFDPDRGVLARFVIGQTHADHSVPGLRRPLERPCHGQCRTTAPHDQDGCLTFTARTIPGQKLSPHPTAQQQAHQPGRQRDGQIEASDIEPEQQRYDGDCAEKLESGRDDPSVFLGPVPNHTRRSGAKNDKERQPQNCEHPRDAHIARYRPGLAKVDLSEPDDLRDCDGP